MFNLILGQYTITQRDDGTFWIRKDDGEGMQVTASKLETMLSDWYEKNF